MTHKILKLGKPEYLAGRLYYTQRHFNLRGQNHIYQPKCKLSIKSEGFVARSQNLMNKLEPSVRREESCECSNRKQEHGSSKIL